MTFLFFQYAFIYVASICALLYFVFLVYKVGRVWMTIKRKRAAALQMNRNRRLKFEGVIYRFKFLMLLTLVCAAFTIISYIMKQVRDCSLFVFMKLNADQLYTLNFYESEPELGSSFLLCILGETGVTVSMTSSVP